jgi:hypothetical protein
MFAVTVHIVVYVLLAVWGGVLATLIGWTLYSVIVDTIAVIFPSRFRKHNYRLYLRKYKKAQAMERQRAKEAFNRRTPPQFSEACYNAIIELIERGPNKSR